MLSLKEQLYEKLREVIDPELGLNIVELGLVYNLLFYNKEKKLISADEAEHQDKVTLSVEIVMTLTSPMCPVGPIIMDEVKKKAEEVLQSVDVKLVWEPAWSQEHLSDEIKLQLGLL